MCKLAVVTEDALVILQKVELTKLTCWLLGLWQVGDVVLIELQVLEVFVDEAVS